MCTLMAVNALQAPRIEHVLSITPNKATKKQISWLILLTKVQEMIFICLQSLPQPQKSTSPGYTSLHSPKKPHPLARPPYKVPRKHIYWLELLTKRQ